MSPSPDLDTLVIGAGHAGLAMSRTLKRAGRSHLVLERSTIGSSWRTRWDSFCLNTPSHHSLLPDATAPKAGEFWPRDTWIEHMESYATSHELPIRTGVTVTSVVREETGFTVETTDGTHRSRHIVLCTGDNNVPHTPTVARQMPEDVRQLHTVAYKNPDSLPEGAVLVVGTGQSGAQIAEDLLEAGREVYVCTSAVGRAPRRYRGRDIIDWMSAIGMAEQRPEDVPEQERSARQGIISGVAGGRSVSLPHLARQGAQLRGRLLGVDGRKLNFADDLHANVEVGDAVVAKLRAGLDMFIEKAGVDAPAATEDPADAPFDGLDAMAAERSLHLDDAGISAVIWATGYRGSFAYLPTEWLDERGIPRQAGGVCEVPGLYCLGLQWGRRRASGLILGAEGDASAILAHMTTA